MCMQTKNIIKIRDVMFMMDSTNIEYDLEMCPSGRHEAHRMIVVDKF